MKENVYTAEYLSEELKKISFNEVAREKEINVPMEMKNKQRLNGRGIPMGGEVMIEDVYTESSPDLTKRSVESTVLYDHANGKDKGEEVHSIGSPIPGNGEKKVPPTPTLLVYQPMCLSHREKTLFHQESPKRLQVLCANEDDERKHAGDPLQAGILRSCRAFQDLQWANPQDLPSIRFADLLRVHDSAYLQHLEQQCNVIKDAKEGNSSAALDNDTYLCHESYKVAKLASGAVCYAIDKVMTQHCENAFVMIRPPGHHAGPYGAVCAPSGTGSDASEDSSLGFCLLNHIAIGAAYAMNRYSPPYGLLTPLRSTQHPTPIVQKIAIIDFDIHHGNGTEEIIRNVVPHEKQYPLPSSWAPVTFRSSKPWRDSNDLENIFFGSIHLYNGREFYPGTGSGPHGESPELRHHPNIINIPLTPLGTDSSIVEQRSHRRPLNVKVRQKYMLEASKEFRSQVQLRLFPPLKAFAPDLILLSAGFDGHADDFYHYLTEDDYAWITKEIKQISQECCAGRIVSILEGGYNVTSLNAMTDQTTKPNSMENVKRTSNYALAAQVHEREMDPEHLFYGSLPRSCAAHVQALAEVKDVRKNQNE